MTGIVTGDCREVLAGMDEASVDAVVTDPPYGFAFMGKAWDAGVPGPEYWAEALRVLKPGGYLLAFGGPRTYHRLACAIEDAGFEIRDQIMWLFGSGFPKSRNLHGEWEGWGTALKPAHEPIVVARKPLAGTVAANVQEYGTGALNIDGCRVSVNGEQPRGSGRKPLSFNGENHRPYHDNEPAPENITPDAGRWPANVIHDGSEEVLAAFPDAPGQQAAESHTAPSAKTSGIYGAMKRQGEPSQHSDNEGAVGFKMKPGARRIDSGSAARFFYCAKAGREDRNEGLEGFDEKALNWSSGTQSPGTFQAEGTKREVANHHPTVKPTALMRYLCRLVTPPGGLILDPFCGSGSTGKAARLEGFEFIGIEIDPEYAVIAEARIGHVRQAGLAL